MPAAAAAKVAMSPAVGLDVGNGRCVLAVSKNGVADAVVSKESKRETPAVVHFADKHRLFGAAAASRITTNPSSTIAQLKRLVGRQFDDAEFQAERHLLPYETIKGDDGGISVKVHFSKNDHTYTAAEMLAMLLVHLQGTTGQAKKSNCVIGVPAYFTRQQKKAYWDAAVIAQWTPVRLVHEGVATALTYRESRTGAGTTSASTVTFVDIGHCDTQVTVVRFQGEEMMVLAEACDLDLGGRDFDEVIFQHFVGKFEKQYGKDIRSNTKASVRLRAACEKAKRVLSANKEADVSIDHLMDGVEYASGAITREKFEELSSSLLGRIGAVFGEAQARAKAVDVNGIDSVEVVGSGSLIPAISRTLTELFGRSLSRTVNGSECVARGCALLCEMIISTPNLPLDIKNYSYLRDQGEAFGDADKLQTSIEKEASLARKERTYVRSKDARNALEFYFYEVRKLNCPAESKEKIYQGLKELEEWLNGEGEEASTNKYLSRMYKLRKEVEPILETPKSEKKPLSEHLKVHPLTLSASFSMDRNETGGGEVSDESETRRFNPASPSYASTSEHGRSRDGKRRKLWVSRLSIKKAFSKRRQSNQGGQYGNK